jgi:HrpA-like RNA helicase
VCVRTALDVYCNLSTMVLQVLLLKLGAPEVFLGQCMEPPSIEQIRASLATLLEIGAVLPRLELPLTALGYHLARMPVDVRIGKMLIYACLLEVGACTCTACAHTAAAEQRCVACLSVYSVWSPC